MEFKRFEYEIKGNTYYVYVIKNEDTWEYWLQDKDYGVMLLMYAINEYNLETLEKNIKNYVETYIDYLKYN